MSTLDQLTKLGVSVWLDDLSRERIDSGNLQELIATRSVRGITTNPTIFANAMGAGSAYLMKLKGLAAQGHGAEAAILRVMADDVRDACDIFKDIYATSKGMDGRVSIEVSPTLAHDTAATVAQALELHELVNRENVMIKIPATKAGLPAITEVIAAGISVNVTLIFAIERYQEVIDAYLSGLELARERGHDLSKIHSVASFFVSRVDTAIDPELASMNKEASLLQGKAAIANARLAYQLFVTEFESDRWLSLESAGANAQRPLMASTGVKNPDYQDTMYVTELAAPNLVNTMPEKTMEATADHGVYGGDTISSNFELARSEIAALESIGISIEQVTSFLEQDGVAKFITSWEELLVTVENAMASS